jgi:hypothetical protein
VGVSGRQAGRSSELDRHLSRGDPAALLPVRPRAAAFFRRPPVGGRQGDRKRRRGAGAPTGGHARAAPGRDRGDASLSCRHSPRSVGESLLLPRGSHAPRQDPRDAAMASLLGRCRMGNRAQRRLPTDHGLRSLAPADPTARRLQEDLPGPRIRRGGAGAGRSGDRDFRWFMECTA